MSAFTWTPTLPCGVKHLEFVRSLGFVLSQQVGSLVGFVVFAALVDRLGGRPTFIAYLVIGAIAVAVLVLQSSPDVLLGTMFFTGFGITGIFARMNARALQVPFLKSLADPLHRLPPSVNLKALRRIRTFDDLDGQLLGPW